MSYTPPPGNAVELPITGAYAPPLGNAVALILGDSGASAITGTAATGQGHQTDFATGALLLTGTAATGQGNQASNAIGTLPVSGNAITGQSQTVAATGESGAAEQPNVAGGRAQRHRLPGVFGQASSGQSTQTTSGSGTLTLVGHIASGQGQQTTAGTGRLTLVGSLHTQQTQTPAAHGVIDRYARARREDELWLLAA